MSTLDVSLGPVRVGVLEQYEDEHYVFGFDPDWLADPDRPLLGQFFEDRRPRDIELWGPPCWFANLLPQGPLRRALARDTGVDEGDVFDLLRAVGEDLPGAVVLRPGTSPLRRPPPVAVSGPLRYGMAGLAGAQWKLSVRPGERGLVLPVVGQTGSWIAKFHDPTLRDLPRIEFATAQWAVASGIDMPAIRLGRVEEIVELPPGIPTGDGSVYLIERFDRGPGERRIHMEDMAQVLDKPPGTHQFSGSHEVIAAVLAAITPDDLPEYCRRVVFCVLAGNTDAHLKNWSILYPDGRQPRLSPAYDLVASVLFTPMLEDCLALSVGGARRFEEIGVDAFRKLAAVCGRSFGEVASWVRDAAIRVRGAWDRHAADWPFTPDERQRLAAHLRRVPL